MSVFQADCPHCGTKSVAFTITAEIPTPPNNYFSWDTLAVCGYCNRGVLANFEADSDESPTALLKYGRQRHLSEPEIYPSRTSNEAPIHIPENLKRFYEQGVDNLQKNWDASGSMFRKALETALKIKFPDVKGDLYHRIEGAKEAGGLTADLAEWSHQIRLDGRNAVHEEKPYEKEDAERLHTFTRLVLLYLFTLPGMLKEARSDVEDETGADP